MDRGSWRIRNNQEVYQLCGENDIVKFCKLSRLRWAGHVIRQDDDDLSRRVLLSEPGGKCPRGRPRLRWEDGLEEDVTRLGCRNWKIIALNRRMEETLEGGWGPPRAVEPLERERNLASSNNALADDGDCTETCRSCFNVNFIILFRATLVHQLVNKNLW